MPIINEHSSDKLQSDIISLCKPYDFQISSRALFKSLINLSYVTCDEGDKESNLFSLRASVKEEVDKILDLIELNMKTAKKIDND